MTALTTDILKTFRRRRSAGESVKAMALEIGVTWQRLDKAIRNGIRAKADRKTRPARPEAQRPEKTLQAPISLTERYRPRELLDIVGQDEIVKLLCMFTARPYPASFLFEGQTGTGKTSAAIAVAGHVGCDLSAKPPEFGGLHIIASGEQTAETVREIYNQLWRSPFSGSGWKVLIVNEADRMSAAAETIWLDRLETLPPKTVIIFTTNYSDKLSRRFRDRCVRMAFESSAESQRGPAKEFLNRVWRSETGSDPDRSTIEAVLDRATEDGQLSYRRALQHLAGCLAAAKPPIKRKEGGK